jgi:CRISPR-associated endonuclease/helicase Cas3
MHSRPSSGGSHGLSTSVDARLWGKSHGLDRPYPLICHLLDTAAVAGELFDRVVGQARGEWLAEAAGVSGDGIRGLLMYWAGLHDLGKISPPFQAKAPDHFAPVLADSRYVAERMTGDDSRFHHSDASHWILAQLFAASGYPASPGPSSKYFVAHQIAQMLGGHHGRFHAKLSLADMRDPRSPKRAASLGTGEWARQAEAHAGALKELIGESAEVVPRGLLPVSAVAILTGLVVCADWLASQESYITSAGRLPEAGWRATGEQLQRHWQAALGDAGGVVLRAGLGQARFRPVISGVSGFRDRFPKISVPNPLQTSLAERLSATVRGAGLLLITAPPGDGKTEAAEFCAAHLAQVCGTGGLAFALPTMATTDAMFRRIQTFAKDNLAQDAALALVHGMAWLNTDFEKLALATAQSDRILTGEGEAGDFAAPFATDWLRGRGRGLHAALGAMTIDQQLTGVLPVKHNMLRLHGLSSKVVVIDEAHSYGPWMHSLLLRLLNWLGAMRVPVVVMSATLAGATARSVLDAYRSGCGYEALPAGTPAVPYPGWLFLDAASGQLSEPVEVGTDRARDLVVRMEPVRRCVTESTSAADLPENERLRVLARLLAPIREEGGCVLVCCNTVAEAQQTYEHLYSQFSSVAEVGLLHARFRAADRARITDGCEQAFGKPDEDGRSARRPVASILVATQIVEQSIDLDFDLIVSDLAPIALLLQRAGRCRRHDRGARPAWTGALGTSPLVVLDPVGEDGEYKQPKEWGAVYFEALLRKTSRLLRGRVGGAISIPQDVSSLVDDVYAEFFATDNELHSDGERAAMFAAEAAQAATEAVERQLANIVAIPRPKPVMDLEELSGAGRVGLIDDALVTTRLGADSARLVLVYVQADGSRTLVDEAGSTQLPGAVSGKSLSAKQIRAIMKHTVPAPGWWLRGGDLHSAAPSGWDDNPLLRDLVVVEGRALPGGGWRSSSAKPQLEYWAQGVGLIKN